MSHSFSCLSTQFQINRLALAGRIILAFSTFDSLKKNTHTQCNVIVRMSKLVSMKTPEVSQALHVKTQLEA